MSALCTNTYLLIDVLISTVFQIELVSIICGTKTTVADGYVSYIFIYIHGDE